MAINIEWAVITALPFLAGALIGAMFTGQSDIRRKIFAALLLGLEYAAAAARFGVNRHSAKICTLLTLITTAAFDDLDKMEIPDNIPFFAVLSYAVFLPLEEYPMQTLKFGVIGALSVGCGITILSMIADKATGRETLGGGDIKLISVLGLYFGLYGGLILIAVSCVAGLVFCKIWHIRQGQMFPFVPSIAVGTFITAIAGDEFISLYQRALNF